MPLVKQCIHPDCTLLIPVGQKRCPTHTLEHKRSDYARRAQKPQRRIYVTAEWKATRIIVLAQADHTCALCGGHATIADHHPIPLTTLLERGLNPYDHNRCRALCPTCSGRHDGRRSNQRTRHHSTLIA